jgi:hypothetical protein
MIWKIPLLDICLFFSFSRHLDVLHHHTSITLHVFVKTEIILINSILFFLNGFRVNSTFYPLIMHL